ncbi:MAG: hypothetical protein K8R54_07190 [Bacteroidales bacterium]|nr:hypothetical protein [Bacteroidales bacterium]
MLNLLIYLLEVSILTSIFYLFYRYLYFKLAYFEMCRYYFFSVLILSLVIPLIPGIFEENIISLKLEGIFKTSGIQDKHNINYINVKDSFLHREDNFFTDIPFVKVLFIIWLSGLIRYLFIILKNITAVIRLINSGEKIKDGKYTIVKTTGKSNAFTFFRFIFINHEFKNLTKKEQEQILTHEKIHADQLHTIDNILFELFRAAFWFNPVSKLTSANIKIIHEFIVDNKLTGNKNHADYSRLILKMVVHNSHAISVSNFSSEEIKNRIKLISFPESEKIRKRRFNISIPVLIATIFAAYLIISTINIYALEKEVCEKEFTKPFKKGTYKIISPFFENKTPSEIYTGYESNIDSNNQYKISHKETSYEVKSFSDVYAIESGIVSHIKKKDVFGLEELNVEIELITGHKVEYRGLYKLTINEEDSIKKGEIIGLTGDIRLYPNIDIKLSKNKISFDPEVFY